MDACIHFPLKTQEMDLNCAKTAILVISQLIKNKTKTFLDLRISAPVKVKIHQKSL